jgi:rubrerythrin
MSVALQDGAAEAKRQQAMNAERFHGGADYPHIIDRADDGTPHSDCRGWTCDRCGMHYAGQAAAEVCCIEPDAVK